MPAAMTHVLSIIVGLSTIALAWYWRLAVATRVPAEETQRMPAYLRSNSPFVWIITIVLTVFVGLSVLFDLFLLVTGDTGDYGSNMTTLVFVLFDLLLIALIIRIRRRIGRSAHSVEP